MKPIKPGALGGEIYAVAEERLKANRGSTTTCTSWRMAWAGQPRGAAADRYRAGQYDAYDADKPLETGMVISVETTLQHPKRGFIKLEDTVVVTDDGFEVYGEGGRGWNRGGTAHAR